jgi:hypothetical protein
MESKLTNKNPVGRPPKFSSVEQLDSLIESYFENCKQENKPYTITGLALWLDTTRETLIDYQENKGYEFSDAIKRAKLKCENWVEEGALMNKVNPTSAIFNLKNNYGWKDKVEQELSNPDGNLKTITIIKTNGNKDNTST